MPDHPSLAGYSWEVKKGTPEKPKLLELVLIYETK